MTDSDVFGKLSRIFETNSFSQNDPELNELLDDFDPNNTDTFDGRNSPKKTKQSTAVVLPDRPTPFDVWQQRNALNMTKQKATPKLNGQQWDRLVDKMHKSNRVKQNAMIKEQNQGLALELGGHQFKPRINKTSAELSATMKPLSERVSGMLAERKKFLDDKLKEAKEAEVAECSFTPTRMGGKTSDQYLRKMGREKATPEDFFRYRAERDRRIEVRKHIVSEIEDKELTFRPQLGEKSLKLQEKLLQRGVIDIDPLTRTTIVTATPNPKDRSRLVRSGSTPLTPSRGDNSSFFVHNTAQPQYYEGPMLQVESEHPYRHNTNEYTTVAIPNAVSYSVTFSSSTRTESIYDFIKFYDDDTHTEYFGAGKYSGGTNESSCNWPGVGGRPPLIIVAPKFIIHFRTNGTVNDYGFCMHIVPTLATAGSSDSLSAPHLSSGGGAALSPSFDRLQQDSSDNHTPNIPQISATGKNYSIANATNYTRHRSQQQKVRVHDRLYQNAVEKTTEYHNSQVDLLQNKLNIALKPWENVRGSSNGTSSAAHLFVQQNSKTHLPKATISEAVEDLLLPEAVDDADELNGETYFAADGSLRLSVHHLNTSQVSKTGATQSNVSVMKGVAVAVVEFDDLYGSIWRQLRSL